MRAFSCLAILGLLFAGCSTDGGSGQKLSEQLLKTEGSFSESPGPDAGSTSLNATEPAIIPSIVGSSLEPFRDEAEIRGFLSLLAPPDSETGTAIEVAPVTPASVPQTNPDSPAPMPLPTVSPGISPAISPAPAPAPSPSPTVSGPAQTSSGTMIQEAAVDEADKVKHDGKFLYIAKGKTLKIVDCRPLSKMAAAAQVELPAPAMDLFLWEGRVAVVTQQILYENSGDSAPSASSISYAGLRFHSARAGVVVLDVTDPCKPVTLSQVHVDGVMGAVRRVGDKLILVLQRPPVPWPAAGDEKPLLGMAPRFSRTLSGYGDPLVGMAEVLHGAIAEGAQMTTVACLSVHDPLSTIRGLSVMDRTDTTYVSESTLYLARSFTPEGSAPAATRIHAVAFDGPRPEYVGTGEVPGTVRDAYSFGEHRGFLRVASETGTWTVPSSTVSVLDRAGRTMTVVGRLGPLAPGDQLDAVRLIGDRGYLFTSVRRIMFDPLLILDLSDPADPRLLGELEMPGFSSRILPISADRMIGLGRDANWGLTLSLYDTSDPARPRKLVQRDLNWRGLSWAWADSEAMTDPKAFQWYPEEGILALPVQVSGSYYSTGYYWNWVNSLDLLLFKIEGDEISLLGGLELHNGNYWGWARAVFLDRDVIGVTRDKVKGAGLDDLWARAWELSLK